ncbi:MAG: IS200/IS605 family transposase, partial [Aggregatilineales bacterium]
MVKRTRHAVYNINYHLVWCPKYRRPVLADPVGGRLAELIPEYVRELDGEVLELVVMPDHVHLFASRLKAKETPGHPRFKGKERFNSLDYTYGDGCKLDYDGHYDRYVLRIQNVGEIKVKLHRPIPTNAKIKHVVVKRRA